jgi:MFS transporter, DHA1 family, multidrug resistance protein
VELLEAWKKNLYVVGTAQLMGFATINFIASFLPLYIKSLGVTDPSEVAIWSGILLGVSAFFAAVSGPIWGNIGDRTGRKLMVVRVLLSNTVISILLGFSSRVWHVLILRSIQGALGGFMAASLALITTITPAAEIGFALGLYQFAMTAGGALGPLLGGFLADTVGFQWTFIIMAGFTLVAALLVKAYVFEDFTPPQETSKQISFFTSLKELLKAQGLLAMLLVNFLVQFSLMVVAPIVPLFIHVLDPGNPYVTTLTGLVIASGGISSAISAIYSGRLSDRLGHKNVLVTMTLGATAATALQLLVTNPWEFLVLRVVAGAFMGGMLPTANALINDLIPGENKGTAFGVSTSFSLMGNVLGPITGGLLGASFIGYRGVFGITAALLLLTALWIKAVIKPVQHLEL